jgi:hypothetical protein
MILTTIFALQVTATMDAAPQSADPPRCRILVASPVDGDSRSDNQILLASCGGKAALIGPAVKVEIVERSATGAVAVVFRQNSAVRVLLVSPGAGAEPVIDDYTRELVEAVGLHPDSSSRSLVVDLSRFGSDGVIVGRTDQNHDSTVGRRAEIQTDRLIDVERRRRH